MIPSNKHYLVFKPKPKGHSDSFFANIYNTYTSYGLNETGLIWNRFGSFLILHGFLINVGSTFGKISEAYELILIGALGIFFSSVWYLINFFGWLSQNSWYAMASQILFVELESTISQSPSEYWRENGSLKPTGMIYKLTQLMPIAVGMIYSIFLVRGMWIIIPDVLMRWLTYLSILVLLILLCVFLKDLCTWELERIEHKERMEIPVS